MDYDEWPKRLHKAFCCLMSPDELHPGAREHGIQKAKQLTTGEFYSFTIWSKNIGFWSSDVVTWTVNKDCHVVVEYWSSRVPPRNGLNETGRCTDRESYTKRQTGRQEDIQIDGQTNRQADKSCSGIFMFLSTMYFHPLLTRKNRPTRTHARTYKHTHTHTHTHKYIYIYIYIYISINKLSASPENKPQQSWIFIIKSTQMACRRHVDLPITVRYLWRWHLVLSLHICLYIYTPFSVSLILTRHRMVTKLWLLWQYKLISRKWKR